MTYPKSGNNAAFVSYFTSGGGGASGGNGCYGYYHKEKYQVGTMWYTRNITVQKGLSGSCLILLCNKINVAQSSLSTGGQCGGDCYHAFAFSVFPDCYSGSGGGTGFCYIACQEMIDSE